MLLRLKKKDGEQPNIEDLSAELSESNRKREYFLLAIRALLQLLKEFALDLKEIDSDGYKNDITHLSEKISTENKLRKVESQFEKGKKRIDAFIELQKRYLIDRENEFKDIIDILTKAMVTLDTENKEYNKKR